MYRETFVIKKGLDTALSAGASKATRPDMTVTTSGLHIATAEDDLYREAFIMKKDFVS